MPYISEEKSDKMIIDRTENTLSANGFTEEISNDDMNNKDINLEFYDEESQSKNKNNFSKSKEIKSVENEKLFIY